MNNLVDDIRNNLDWLNIDIKEKTFNDIIKELESYKGKDESLALETILKIKIILGGGENEK